MGTKLILFCLIFSIFCQNSIAGRANPSTKSKRNVPQIKKNMLKSHEHYDFKSCKQYTNSSPNYLLVCKDNTIQTQEALNDLDKDTQKIKKHIFTNNALEDLRDYTLKHLNAKRAELDKILKCLNNLNNDDCSLIINDLFTNTKADLKKMRHLLALKDRPLPQSGLGNFEAPQPFRRLIKHSVKPFYSEPLQKLTKLEEKEVRDIYDKHYNSLKKSWPRDNRTKHSQCIKQNNEDQSYYVLDNSTCSSVLSSQSIETDSEFNKVARKSYENQYLDLIQKNPLLMHLNLPSDAPEQDLFSHFLQGLEKISQSLNKSISEVSSLENKDLNMLLSYSALTDGYIKSIGSKKYICDIMQELKDHNDYNKLTQDVAIGVGVIGAGVLCGVSAGMTCGLASVIGAEAITLSMLNNRYNDSNIAFQSSLVKAEDLSQKSEELNLASALVPTALFGLNSGVKLTKTAITNIRNNKVSTVSKARAEELFDQMKNQGHIPFCYTKKGCEARAHEMSRLLEEEGVITEKAFIEGKMIMNSTYDGEFVWDFHVAPLIKVKENGKTQIYIIDPSLFDKPVPIDEWHTQMLKHSDSYELSNYRRSRFHYVPKDKKENLNSYKDEDIKKMKETMKKYYKRHLERVNHS